MSAYDTFLDTVIDSDDFLSLKPEERGGYITAAKNDFISKYSDLLSEDRIAEIPQITESKLAEYRHTINEPRYQPSQEELQTVALPVPTFSPTDSFEKREKGWIDWANNNIAKFSAENYRSAEKEDVEVFFNSYANQGIREAAFEKNKTSNIGHYAYTLAQGLAEPVSRLVGSLASGPEGAQSVDRFFAGVLPEDPSRKEEVGTMIAAGIGDVGTQLVISGAGAFVGGVLGGGPGGAVAGASIASSAYNVPRYMTEGFNREWERTGNENQSWDAAISQIPAALLETAGDMIFLRSGSTMRGFAKAFAQETTEKGRRAILSKAIQSYPAAAGRGFLSEGLVGGVGAEWASGLGLAMATGHDEYYKQSLDGLMKSGFAEGVVGAIFGVGFKSINKTGQSMQLSKEFGAIQGAQDIADKQDPAKLQKDVFDALQRRDFRKVIELTSDKLITDPSLIKEAQENYDASRGLFTNPITGEASVTAPVIDTSTPEGQKAQTHLNYRKAFGSLTKTYQSMYFDEANPTSELGKLTANQARNPDEQKRFDFLSNRKKEIEDGTYKPNYVINTNVTQLPPTNNIYGPDNNPSLGAYQVTLNDGTPLEQGGSTFYLNDKREAPRVARVIASLNATHGDRNISFVTSGEEGIIHIRYQNPNGDWVYVGDGAKKNQRPLRISASFNPSKGSVPVVFNQNGDNVSFELGSQSVKDVKKIPRDFEIVQPMNDQGEMVVRSKRNPNNIITISGSIAKAVQLEDQDRNQTKEEKVRIREEKKNARKKKVEEDATLSKEEIDKELKAIDNEMAQDADEILEEADATDNDPSLFEQLEEQQKKISSDTKVRADYTLAEAKGKRGYIGTKRGTIKQAKDGTYAFVFDDTSETPVILGGAGGTIAEAGVNRNITNNARSVEQQNQPQQTPPANTTPKRNPAFENLSDEQLQERFDAAIRLSQEVGRSDAATWAYDARLMAKEIEARKQAPATPAQQQTPATPAQQQDKVVNVPILPETKQSINQVKTQLKQMLPGLEKKIDKLTSNALFVLGNAMNRGFGYETMTEKQYADYLGEKNKAFAESTLGFSESNPDTLEIRNIFVGSRMEQLSQPDFEKILLHETFHGAAHRIKENNPELWESATQELLQDKELNDYMSREYVKWNKLDPSLKLFEAIRAINEGRYTKNISGEDRFQSFREVLQKFLDYIKDIFGTSKNKNIQVLTINVEKFLGIDNKTDRNALAVYNKVVRGYDLTDLEYESKKILDDVADMLGIPKGKKSKEDTLASIKAAQDEMFPSIGGGQLLENQTPQLEGQKIEENQTEVDPEILNEVEPVEQLPDESSVEDIQEVAPISVSNAAAAAVSAPSKGDWISWMRSNLAHLMRFAEKIWKQATAGIIFASAVISPMGNRLSTSEITPQEYAVAELVARPSTFGTVAPWVDLQKPSVKLSQNNLDGYVNINIPEVSDQGGEVILNLSGIDGSNVEFRKSPLEQAKSAAKKLKGDNTLVVLPKRAAKHFLDKGSSLQVDSLAEMLYEQESSSTKIAEMLTDMGISQSPDTFPWCATSVSYALTRSGIPTSITSSREFLNVGVETQNPKYGDLVVMWNSNPDTGGKNGWGGHVGFYLGEVDGAIAVLSGNVKDEVNVSLYSQDRVLGYRDVSKTKRNKTNETPFAEIVPNNFIGNKWYVNTRDGEIRGPFDTVKEAKMYVSYTEDSVFKRPKWTLGLENQYGETVARGEDMQKMGFRLNENETPFAEIIPSSQVENLSLKGNYGAWINPKADLVKVKGSYGHILVAEEIEGKKIKEGKKSGNSTYDVMDELGYVRVVNGFDNVLVETRKPINSSQKKTLEWIGMNDEKNITQYLPNGSERKIYDHDAVRDIPFAESGDRFVFRLAPEFKKDNVLGLVIANDGTLPVENLNAKIRKSGANEFEIEKLTELVNDLSENGRVNVKELSDIVDVEPTLVINTLSVTGANVSERDKLEHEFDNIQSNWRDFVEEDEDNIESISSLGVRLDQRIQDRLAEWMDYENENVPKNQQGAATGRFGVDPYSNEQLEGNQEISPGHKLIWSGDLSLNVPGDKKFESQHYLKDSDVAKNQLAFVRGGIHEYQSGTQLPDGTTANEVTRIMEIWEVQSDWDGKESNFKDRIKGYKKSDLIYNGSSDVDFSLKFQGSSIFLTLEQAKEIGFDVNKYKNGDIVSQEDKIKFVDKWASLEEDTSSPLLKYWESLALKAAVNYAQKQGATNIIVSDAETAMMTEGHDNREDFKYKLYSIEGKKVNIYNGPTPNTYELDGNVGIENGDIYVYTKGQSDERIVLTFNKKPKNSKVIPEAKELVDIINNAKNKGLLISPELYQEKGMRAAYDQRVPNGLKKLTGSKPKKVTIGIHGKAVIDGWVPAPAQTLESGFVIPAGEVAGKVLSGSKVFKNPDGTPKNTNTGTMFAIPAARNVSNEIPFAEAPNKSIGEIDSLVLFKNDVSKNDQYGKFRITKDNLGFLPQVISERLQDWKQYWADGNIKKTSQSIKDSKTVFIKSDSTYTAYNPQTKSTATLESMGEMRGVFADIKPGQNINLPYGMVVLEESYLSNGQPVFNIHFNSIQDRPELTQGSDRILSDQETPFAESFQDTLKRRRIESTNEYFKSATSELKNKFGIDLDINLDNYKREIRRWDSGNIKLDSAETRFKAISKSYPEISNIIELGYLDGELSGLMAQATESTSVDVAGLEEDTSFNLNLDTGFRNKNIINSKRRNELIEKLEKDFNGLYSQSELMTIADNIWSDMKQADFQYMQMQEDVKDETPFAENPENFIPEQDQQAQEDLIENIPGVFGIPDGSMSPERVEKMRQLRKTKSRKVEARMMPEEKKAFQALKNLKHGAMLSDESFNKYIEVFDRFVDTRRKTINDLTSRETVEEILNMTAEFKNEADTNMFNNLKESMPEAFLVDGKDMTFEDFDRNFDRVRVQIQSFLNAQEVGAIPVPTQTTETRESFEDRIYDMREEIYNDREGFLGQTLSYLDDVLQFQVSNGFASTHINKGIDLMRQTVEDAKAFYNEYINFLVDADISQMSDKQVREVYYSLMGASHDSYMLAADNFVSGDIINILSNPQNFIDGFTGRGSRQLITNVSSINTQLRQLTGNREAYLSLLRLTSRFNESVKRSEMFLQQAMVPYQKDTLNYIEKKFGRKMTTFDFIKSGMYAELTKVRDDETVQGAIEANIAQLKKSFQTMKDTKDKGFVESANQLISDLDSITGTTLEEIEQKARNVLGGDVVEYTDMLRQFFNHFEPMAKFTTEFVYGREYHRFHNYMPTAIKTLSKDGKESMNEVEAHQALLNMTHQDRGEVNINTTGMASTFDKTRGLGRGQVLELNINYLYSNRGRLNILDYFTAIPRREMSNVMRPGTEANKAFGKFIGDESGLNGRIEIFNGAVLQSFRNVVESTQYIAPFHGLVNNIVGRWAGMVLSSAYQFPIQFVSNLMPWMYVNIGNPSKLADFWSAASYLIKYKSGRLNEYQTKIVERLLFDMKNRNPDAVRDKNVELSPSQLLDWAKNLPGYSALEKLDKVREWVQFKPFMLSDMMSGDPILLTEYLHNLRQKTGNKNITLEDMTYDAGSYFAALDETERFVGIGNASRRGKWMNNKNALATVVRHMLTGFASHRVNNATNAMSEWRKIINPNTSIGDKAKSFQYMSGIAIQSAIFTYGKMLAIQMLMGAFKNMLSGDEDEDELVKLYNKRNAVMTDSEKKLIDIEIAKRREIRKVWNQIKQKEDSSEFLALQIGKDALSNIFVIPSFMEFVPDVFIWKTFDASEKEAFSMMKSQRQEELKRGIKNATNLREIKAANRMKQELSDLDSMEAIQLVNTNYGTAIPMAGMYGGALKNMESIWDAVRDDYFLNAKPMDTKDFLTAASAFGFGFADMQRYFRLQEKIQKAEDKASEKIEDFAGERN